MKKAIVVVSFGTSYEEPLKNSIEKIENRIKDKFSDYEVHRAFTSHMIIRKIEKVQGIKIPTPEEKLQELYENGVKEVVMQPLHIIPGEEYEYIQKVQSDFEGKFDVIKLGRPIFYYQGVEDVPDDYTLFIKSIEHILKENENVVMFGHGTAHPAGSVYGCIQAVLQDEGYDNVFVGTVEGYPSFDNVLKRLKKKNIKEILLMPLMVVAGDHVINDMASDEEDSWKSLFEAEGIKVNLYMKGLGEIDSFNDLYMNRVDDLINDRYVGIGHTKKGKRDEDTNCFVKL